MTEQEKYQMARDGILNDIKKLNSDLARCDQAESEQVPFEEYYMNEVNHKMQEVNKNLQEAMKFNLNDLEGDSNGSGNSKE